MAMNADRLREAARHFRDPCWAVVPVLHIPDAEPNHVPEPLFPYAFVHPGGGQVVIRLDGPSWKLVGRDDQGRPLQPEVTCSVPASARVSAAALGQHIERHVLDVVVKAVAAKRASATAAAGAEAALLAARRCRQALEERGLAASLDRALEQSGIVWVVPEVALGERAYVAVRIDEPGTVSVEVDGLPQERAAGVVLAVLAELWASRPR